MPLLAIAAVALLLGVAGPITNLIPIPEGSKQALIFLFGIVHLNPWQFVSGMVMGAFAGWVYYRSRSLLAAIVIHAAAFLLICIHFLNREFAQPGASSRGAVVPPSTYGNLRSLVLVAMTLISVATAHSATAAQRSDEQLVGEVDALVATRLQQPGGVGFSVAIAGGGDVILAEGYGRAELEHDVAADADTVFRVGSVTKQFTAAAIMRLVEQGKLSLDDDITTYLPGFPTRGRVVTIRHLLAHTSGIKSYTGVDDFWKTGVALELSVDELLAYVEELEFDFVPGEQFKYSNTNYYMLGAIVERASGVPYCRFLQDEFFTPLNLSRIRCDSNADIIANRAQGYRFEAGKLANDGLQAMKNYGGAGMIIATARDLVAWEMALMGGQVVSAESLQQMITPTILPGGESTGYGFGLNPGEFRGHRAIMHSGGLPGFGAMLAYFPDDDLYIAVISNVFEGGPAQSVTRDIAAAVFGAGLERAATVDLAPGAESIARFSGMYVLQRVDIEVEVFERDGYLFLQPAGQGATRLLYQGQGEFRVSGEPAMKIIFDPESGQDFVLHQGGRQVKGIRQSDARALATGSRLPQDPTRRTR